MSAAGRGGAREPANAYLTPHWAVWRLLDELPLPAGRWLEPMAGEGDLIRAVNHWRAQRALEAVQWTACELRRPCARLLLAETPRLHLGDVFQLVERVRPERFDVIITNPSFPHAYELVKLCRERAPHVWLALLLRQGFLASASRASFLRRDTPDTYHLPDRPPFRRRKTEKGTDNADYMWAVWPPGGPRKVGSTFLLDTTPAGVRRALREERHAWARAVRAPSSRS